MGNTPGDAIRKKKSRGVMRVVLSYTGPFEDGNLRDEKESATSRSRGGTFLSGKSICTALILRWT